MIWDVFIFLFGAACATGITWWLWKGTPGEKAALKAEIARLKSQVTDRF